ncbi:MAG: hypothetical protein AAF318_13400 [Pseudomonadota bacterium]
MDDEFGVIQVRHPRLPRVFDLRPLNARNEARHHVAQMRHVIRRLAQRTIEHPIRLEGRWCFRDLPAPLQRQPERTAFNLSARPHF